jgi:hypothetical protein
LFLAFLTQIDVSKAACNTCLTTSKVACVSDTQFFRCSGGSPVLTRIYSCNPGEVCADTATGCVSNNLPLAQCKLCNQCNTAGFACTGLDTYARCAGGRPVLPSVRCAPTEFCDIRGISLNQICKPSKKIYPTCNIPDALLNAGITTPVPSTTTTAGDIA